MDSFVGKAGILLIALIILNIVCGSFLLIAGVFFLSSSLEKMGQGSILKLLSRKQSMPKAFIAAVIITAAVQSSTAIMVITVSLAGSGVINLNTAMGIIYGANIGTTVTAQVMSLNISNAYFVLLAAGIILKGIAWFYKRLNEAAMALLGLGMLFAGLKVMNMSIPYIQNNPEVLNFITNYGDNTLNCLLFGFFATVLVQSSAATVGLSMALFGGGLIGFPAGVAMMLGDNVGTCMTAQIASIGSDVNARRVAWGHTVYNLAGSLLVLAFLPWFNELVILLTHFLNQPKSSLIANSHTVFNLLSAVLFMPFNRYYVRFITRFVSEPTQYKMAQLHYGNKKRRRRQ